MKYKIINLFKVGLVSIFLVNLLLFFSGCASSKKTVKETKKKIAATATVSKMITDITTVEDAQSTVVIVKGNRVLTYTAVKQPFPLAVLLYFPDTAVADSVAPSTSGSDIINTIKSAELRGKGHTARLEIALNKDTSYTVSRDGTALKISFKKASAAVFEDTSMKAAAAYSSTAAKKNNVSAVQAQPALMENRGHPATILDSIDFEKLEKGISIFVKTDGEIKNYKTFTTDSPARIVFDIFNIKSPYKTEQSVKIGSDYVKQVRYYGYPDRLRIVLDTKSEYLAAFSADSVQNGLAIHVGSDEKKPISQKLSMAAKKVSSGENTTPAATPQNPAWINSIDFASEHAGKSTIIIGTTLPVKYNLKKTDDKKLLLNLYNTRLPDYRRRPLITTRFKSAVDRITPLQASVKKNTALIVIELRESVPYYVEQSNDLVMLHFDASAIPPKPLEKAGLPAWQKVMTQAVSQAEGTQTITGAETKAGGDQNMGNQAPPGKYTGEKIALNFYQTDIKNVLRILMQVSGKNFALDKDVSGQVTLTFDKPVPWDQVLDLILRMNRLGKVYDGDIIRIATLKTLKTEEADRKSKIASEQKFKDQQKALEPLVTEYIPVNYANAQSDVSSHIEKILSKRGSITVDERNNQIIITDVPEKIKMAKETIKRIDKVTPQVLIEARIVEATNSFSRDFGVSLTNGKLGPLAHSALGKIGGDIDFTFAAINPPAASLGSLGINFSRLTGTNFLLNATIAAAESNGEVKIISAPKILTLDNTAASIKQGLAYPYNKLDADGNTTIEWKDIALELEVTPHVTPDNRISMDITIKNNEIGAVINNQISFTTKEATTKLLVNDGNTIIIAGIRKTRKDLGESGVPGLKDLPVIGWLFKSKTKSNTKEELLIFITPKIVHLEQRNSPG